MLARIAHDLYWLGRHLVRAEHTARMLDGLFHADLQGRPDDPASVTLSWDAKATGVALKVSAADADGHHIPGSVEFDATQVSPSAAVAIVKASILLAPLNVEDVEAGRKAW